MSPRAIHVAQAEAHNPGSTTQSGKGQLRRNRSPQPTHGILVD